AGALLMTPEKVAEALRPRRLRRVLDWLEFDCRTAGPAVKRGPFHARARSHSVDLEESRQFQPRTERGVVRALHRAYYAGEFEKEALRGSSERRSAGHSHPRPVAPFCRKFPHAAARRFRRRGDQGRAAKRRHAAS